MAPCSLESEAQPASDSREEKSTSHQRVRTKTQEARRCSEEKFREAHFSEEHRTTCSRVAAGNDVVTCTHSC